MDVDGIFKDKQLRQLQSDLLEAAIIWAFELPESGFASVDSFCADICDRPNKHTRFPSSIFKNKSGNGFDGFFVSVGPEGLDEEFRCILCETKYHDKEKEVKTNKERFFFNVLDKTKKYGTQLSQQWVEAHLQDSWKRVPILNGDTSQAIAPVKAHIEKFGYLGLAIEFYEDASKVNFFELITEKDRPDSPTSDEAQYVITFISNALIHLSNLEEPDSRLLEMFQSIIQQKLNSARKKKITGSLQKKIQKDLMGFAASKPDRGE